MKTTTISKGANELVVLCENTTYAHMNTLRRLCMNEVPTLAIELVEFTKNSSILYDEIIALRLGLLPLATDLGSYSLPSETEKESGDYSAKSSVKATLKAKGPCVVYAKDLNFKDPKVKPVYPDMPIVKLLEGQDVELIATAVLGVGREHAKWSPCLAYYRQRPTITISKNADTKAIAANLKDLSLTAISEKGGKLVIDDKQLLLTEHAGAYEDVSSDIRVSYADDAFVFVIESWGQLSPTTIINTAIERMQRKLKEFASLVKAL
ncbi:DNA-directed RNA polymerase subunit D [Candidatus Woesearchaeota archaeon]|nr:MAG: DNA-directed RNA polymerase subunit D [Candidatus Woesearchaeota archaeon]